MNTKSKQQLPIQLDIMESLNIKLQNTGPGKGFYEDKERRVFTKQRDPLFTELWKKKKNWIGLTLLGAAGAKGYSPFSGSWLTSLSLIPNSKLSHFTL